MEIETAFPREEKKTGKKERTYSSIIYFCMALYSLDHKFHLSGEHSAVATSVKNCELHFFLKPEIEIICKH